MLLKQIGQRLLYLVLVFPLLLLSILPDIIMEIPILGERHPWPQTLLACLVVIGVIYAGYRIAKSMQLIRFESQLFSQKTVVMIAGAYALATLTDRLSYAWLEAIGKADTANQEQLLESIAQLPMVFNLLSVAALPAMMEELICRGLLMKKLFGSYQWFGLVVSSFIFAAFHGPTDFPSWFMYGSAGLIMGYLYLKTDNLAYPIMLHFVNNLIALIAFYHGS